MQPSDASPSASPGSNSYGEAARTNLQIDVLRRVQICRSVCVTDWAAAIDGPRPIRRYTARICLKAQNGSLRLTVSDDGTGYDTRHTPLGSGLRNMADRLAALSGQLEIRSAPRQGTTITWHLPATPSPAAIIRS